MISTRLIQTACVLAFVLALQPVAARSETVTASSLFRWVNSSFTSNVPGQTMSAEAIIPGGSGVGSGLDAARTFPTFNYGVHVAVLQDYGVFRGEASVSAGRTNPGADFEFWQLFGEGQFKETLTIPAPAGVANGSVGNLMLGWDITGAIRASDGGSASLSISARTSAPLPNSSSNIPAFFGSGHYELASSIPFFFGTPFELTVDSSVFAGIGYDYRFTTPSLQFSATAEAGFLHTAVLSTAAVSDAAGTPVPDFTITTASGRAFPVAVPEPGTLALACWAPLLVGIYWRRRRTCRHHS